MTKQYIPEDHEDLFSDIEVKVTNKGQTTTYLIKRAKLEYTIKASQFKMIYTSGGKYFDTSPSKVDIFNLTAVDMESIEVVSE